MVHRFGEFELDLSAHELRRNGKPVAVEPQVFGVIAYLVSKPNQLVTRDELLQNVWGDSFVSDATLSSRVMAARKALGDTGKEQRWIKTVHGVGFRFASEVHQGSALDEAAAAFERNDITAASRCLEQAVFQDDADQARWHSLMGQLLLIKEGWGSEAAREHYQRAIELAEGVGAVEVFKAARYHLATMFEIRGDYARSETLMRAATMQAEDSEAQELLACSLFHQGRFRESLEQATRGIQIQSESNVCRLAAYYGEHPHVSCHYWLALSLWFTGQEDEALKHASRALRISEEPGRIFCLAHSRQQAAMLHQIRGDLHLCEHWASATVAIGSRQNLPYRECAGKILLGWARVMLGHPGDHLSTMHACLEGIVGLGARMEAPYFQGLCAECEIKLGDKESAVERLDRALSSPAVERGFFYTAELLRLRSLASADFRVARKFLDQAIEVATAQDAKALAARCAEHLTGSE